MRKLVSRIVCLVTLAGVIGLHAQTAFAEATAVQTAFAELRRSSRRRSRPPS